VSAVEHVLARYLRLGLKVFPVICYDRIGASEVIEALLT
jgi:hypothetical protein